MTSIGKETEAINAYLIKNSMGEGGGGEQDGGGGGGGKTTTGGVGGSEGSRKDWAELYGCIK